MRYCDVAREPFKRSDLNGFTQTTLSYSLAPLWSHSHARELELTLTYIDRLAFRAYVNHMNVWFTSDEHYDHKNIIKYCNRPFRDVDHQIAELIARHNSVVGKDDKVVHLGDFCFNEKNVKPILSQLNGKHLLVVGNHDKCHPCHGKKQSSYTKYIEYGFCAVKEEIITSQFVLHHMPYVSDSRHDTRYSEYRPKDDGVSWLLHGHIHDMWKTNDRMINVGVDVWDYTPVSYSQLLEIKVGWRFYVRRRGIDFDAELDCLPE